MTDGAKTSRENSSPSSTRTTVGKSWQLRERSSHRILERVQASNNRLNTLCQEQLQELDRKQVRTLYQTDKAKRHLQQELKENGVDVTLVASRMRNMSGSRTHMQQPSGQTQMTVLKAKRAHVGNDEDKNVFESSGLSESDNDDDVFSDDDHGDGDVKDDVVQPVLEAWNETWRPRCHDNTPTESRMQSATANSSTRSRLSVIYRNALQEATEERTEESPTLPARSKWSEVREHIRANTNSAFSNNGKPTSAHHINSPSPVGRCHTTRNHINSPSPATTSNSSSPVCSPTQTRFGNNRRLERPSTLNRSQTCPSIIASPCTDMAEANGKSARFKYAYQFHSLMADDDGERQTILAKLRNDATLPRRRPLEHTTSRYLIRYDHTLQNERILEKVDGFLLHHQATQEK